MKQQISRRLVLRTLGTAFAVVPASRLLGCASPAMPDAGSGDADDATNVSIDAGLDASIGSDVQPSAADALDAGPRWTTGGTAAMSGAAAYPDPFAGSNPTACSLICRTTIGPCHAASPMRTDVSDGLDGVPVRLVLRILDEACRPLPGAIVEIWQTNVAGIYSGSGIDAMCNSAAEDRAAMYFRGYQRTDASGRVDFATCLPGWYPGRAVHIHVRIMIGDYVATDTAPASIVTQMLFADDLVREVYDTVPLYADRGPPPVFSDRDSVTRTLADRSPYILDVARMPDGAMLASKTIIVRSSLATPVCAIGSGA